MPEMRFHIRWPDGANEQCYSPSLVIKDHLAVGASYDVGEFMQRARIALTIASDRVREKYGFACSRAMGQLARLEAAAERFRATPQDTATDVVTGVVTVTSFQE
jgi:uncharacterized repeat protein (TIGR04042 family)